MVMRLFSFAMLLLCCLGGTHAASGNTPAEAQIGDVLRDAALQGLNGPPKRLAEFRGRPLIINVWASWCGPCKSEMQSLERLAWLEPAGRFAVIGISTDDYPDEALGLLKQTNATISQFIDTQLQMEHLLGATRLPLTVLVGADGRVLDKVYGAREWDSPDALRLIGKTFGIKFGAPPR
jgi:thiol-disulfide isomerase/thioredoxin